MTAPSAPLPARPTVAGLRLDVGLLALVTSSAFFASSGPFAKALLTTGWTSGAIVTARVGIAGLLLLGPALWALRGRWAVLRRNLRQVTAFGLAAVAGCQVAYFNAVQQLPIAVALLLEYLGIALVVLWMWVRHQHRPGPATLAGLVLAVAGLVLVLGVTGATGDLVGVVWGLLAGAGLAVYYVLSAHADRELPEVALAGVGMLVGALALVVLLTVGALPAGAATTPVALAGGQWPWWVAVLELAVVAAAAAYLLGTIGARRLGSTVASFVGLTEVLFAVLLAWFLLGELPVGRQVVGGLLILAGVAAVRIGELRRTPAEYS